MRQALEAARPLGGRQRGPFFGNAEIGDCSLSTHRLLRAVERLDAYRSGPHRDALDPRRAGREDVEFKALVREPLPRAWDPAQGLHQDAADGLCAPPPPPPPHARPRPPPPPPPAA